MSLVNSDLKGFHQYQQYDYREEESSIISSISSVVSGIFQVISEFFCNLASSITNFFGWGFCEREEEYHYTDQVAPTAPPLQEFHSYHSRNGEVEMLPVAQRIIQEPINVNDARAY